MTVDASALTDATLLSDARVSESTATSFTLTLLPGTHELSNASAWVTFTVNPDGTISFPASEDNLLVLQISTTLIVKALS